MTRRSVEATRRFHLFLYESDLEYLERRFGSGAPSSNRIGVGTACREIIHDRVKKLRARETERLTNIQQQIEASLAQEEYPQDANLQFADTSE